MKLAQLLFLTIGVFVSCAPPRPGNPVWLVVEQDQGLDGGRWWLAAASAESEERAQQAAEERLREKVLCSLAPQSAAPGEREESDRLLAELVKQLTAQKLRRFRQSDGGRYAVLVGVQKSELEEKLIRLMRQLARREGDTFQQAAELIRRGQAGKGLQLIARACQARCLRLGLEKKLARPSPEGPEQEGWLRRLADSLQPLRLKLIRSEALPAQSGGRRAAFVVGAFFERDGQGEPVAGLPLGLVGSREATGCITSELGVCRFELAGEAMEAGTVRLGLAVVASDAARSCLDEALNAGPTLEIPVPLEQKAAGRLLLLVRVRGAAAGRQREMFERELGGLFASRGYRLVPAEAAEEELAMAETLEEALPELARLADLVLVMNVLVSPGRDIGGRLFFCQAEAAARLSKVPGGDLVFQEEKRLQAAGGTAEKACGRAAGLLLKEISLQLENFLGREKP
jgi:hypothetical protein